MPVERRREPRMESYLPVVIWGIDAEGLPFSQSALARNISGSGALLCGVERVLRCGDMIRVQYKTNRARYRVIWSRDSDNGEKVRAAVERFKADPCPWEDQIPGRQTPTNPGQTQSQPQLSGSSR